MDFGSFYFSVMNRNEEDQVSFARFFAPSSEIAEFLILPLLIGAVP